MSWKSSYCFPAAQSTAADLLEESRCLLSDSVVLINVLKITSLLSVSPQTKINYKISNSLNKCNFYVECVGRCKRPLQDWVNLCSNFQAYFFILYIWRTRTHQQYKTFYSWRDLWGKKIILIKIPFTAQHSRYVFIFFCELDGLERPLPFEFFDCINSKRMPDWKNNAAQENSPFGSSLTQCPRLTATHQTNFVTLAHRNKNWSVWIDWIAVALEGLNGGTQTNISTYPSIRPSIHLSIHPSRQTSVSLTGMLLTVTALLTGQRGAPDYGTRGRHECLSGWCGE